MSEMKTIIKEKETNDGKKGKTYIDVSNHLEFTGGLKTDLVSSISLAETIGMMLSSVMDDYYGCRIRVNDGNYSAPNIISSSIPAGEIYVEIYLKDSGKSESVHKNLICNVDTNPDKNKRSMSDRFKGLMGSQSSNVYTVTDETYEMLSDFMYPNMRNRNAWRSLTSEIYTVVNQPHGGSEVLKVITGLSLNALITKIYGDRTEEGQFEYMTTPSTRIPYKNNEFIVQITQLNKKLVRDLEATLGVYTSNSEIHTYHR